MATSLAGFIRMPGIEHHANRGDGIGNREENTVFETSRAGALALQSLAEEGHAAVGSAVLQKVNRQHDKNCWLQERPPERGFFDRLQFRGLSGESRFEIFFFFR